MQLNHLKLIPFANRAGKLALLASLSLIVAFGALVAKTLFDDHQANASLTLRLCKKGSSGGCDVFDQVKGAINLTISTANATGGEVNTAHIWNFRSEGGRQGKVKLQRAGRFQLNAGAGLLTFDLPFEIELDGKRFSQNVNLTTDSVFSPVGQLKTKKAEVVGQTVSADLAGFARLKTRDLVGGPPAIVGGPPAKDSRTSGVVGGSAGLPEELIATLEISARAKW